VTRMRALASALAMAVGISTIARSPLSAATSWPTIRPTHVRWTFATLNQDTPGVLLILDTTGRTVYKLECHNGEYDDTGGYNYSGDFQCTLFAWDGGKRVGWNLLATDSKDERSSDWFNRGRMTANQLVGACGATAYGRTRGFRLRGMKIVLRYTDLQWSQAGPPETPRLAGFTFEASVVPDPTATSSTAEKVRDPPC
jgi:hypothetical protein